MAIAIARLDAQTVAAAEAAAEEDALGSGLDGSEFTLVPTPGTGVLAVLAGVVALLPRARRGHGRVGGLMPAATG